MNQNRWIRLYRDSLHNPKIVSLSDRQHRIWHNLLLIADDNGALPRARDVACHLRMTMQEAEQAIQELVEAGLVDPNVLGPCPHRFTLHDWETHQYVSDSSAERTREYRKRLKEKDVTSRDASRDVTETPSEPDTDSDTDLVPSSSEKMPRAKEQSFKFDSRKGFGRGGRDNLESLVKSAEGFGLPVDELIAITNKTKPRNRPAYFTTLCANRLQQKLPGINEGLVRDALWGKGNAAGTLYDALLQAEAV